MTPSSFFFAIGFIVFLLPLRFFKESTEKKEKEEKNYTSVSVNLHLKSESVKSKTYEYNSQTAVKADKLNPTDLLEESFNESPVELEAWMSDPQTWNNNAE